MITNASQAIVLLEESRQSAISLLRSLASKYLKIEGSCIRTLYQIQSSRVAGNIVDIDDTNIPVISLVAEQKMKRSSKLKSISQSC